MIILETAEHVARKRHFCDSCGRSIEPGHSYMRQRNIWDGVPNTYKAHADCWRASEIVGKALDLAGEPFPNVTDFEPDDRAAVVAEDPRLAARLWPDNAGRNAGRRGLKCR